MSVSEPANPAAHEVGDVIGPYRLLRKLGEGTAAKVFEVEHVRIGRRAAMKIVHPDAAVPGIVKRLFIEAQAVNLIGNPHIVEITDVIEPSEECRVHALVMELLEGRCLADLLARQQPIPPQQLLPIMAQVCDALVAVHAAGFIHRDLKPENVFLVRQGANDDFVKLLDFGLVKAMRADVASPKSTVEGTFLGSPAYASPEQAAGKPVDFRTDIYAVGVMLYELVTGRLPFEAENIGDVLIKQISQPAPRLPDVLLSTELGLALDAIIQTCLSKDPGARALSAAQLAGMFRRLASGGAGAAKDVVRTKALRARARRRRAHRLTVPIVVGICAMAVFVAARTTTRAPRPVPRPATPALLGTAAALATTENAAPAPSCPAATTTKAEPRPAPTARRWARALGKIDRAVTLDPYR
jgi:serine/threonine protein kinase